MPLFKALPIGAFPISPVPPSRMDEPFEAVRSLSSSQSLECDYIMHYFETVLHFQSSAILWCGALCDGWQCWNKEHGDIWGSWDQTARTRKMGACQAEVKPPIMRSHFLRPLRTPASTTDITSPSEWRFPFPCISSPFSVIFALVVLSCLQVHWPLSWV